jgi:hypothetical protein
MKAVINFIFRKLVGDLIATVAKVENQPCILNVIPRERNEVERLRNLLNVKIQPSVPQRNRRH